MATYRKCPRCGSTHVQLSNEYSKHGCLMTILFGWYYVMLVIVKWIVGLILFVVWDWWMAIIHAILRKGHVWQCKKWFSGYKRLYYCHDCGYNFKE